MDKNLEALNIFIHQQSVEKFLKMKDIKNTAVGWVAKWRTWPAQWAVTADAAAAVGSGLAPPRIIWGKFRGVRAYPHAQTKTIVWM